MSEKEEDFSVLEDRSNQKKSNTTTNKKKFRVCQDQTDEERRAIRKKQRLLQKEIEERGDDLEVDEARDRNNEIFAEVRFIREATLDAENVNLIAAKAANKVDQMIMAPRYDADRVVSKLIQRCRYVAGDTSFFDWKKLGIEAGVCFNAVPSNVTFLNGPIQDGQEELPPVKQRVVRQRHKHVEEEAVEERPENVEGHTTRGADQLSAVQKNITDVAESLRAKVDREYNKNKAKLTKLYGKNIPEKITKKLRKSPGVCGIELLFNPKSFTQTVENIFHYSFLVKKGEAGISIRKEKPIADGVTIPAGPAVRYCPLDNMHPPARQAIVSLTMKDWRDLIQAYGVKQSDVPHRTGSKFQHRTSATAPAQHQYEPSDEEDVEEDEE